MRNQESKPAKSPSAYRATTRNITVSVEPRYLEDQSDPEKNRYVWAYAIEIFNDGNQTVQLKERTWVITDGKGHVDHVNGPGVVGEQPILNPGDSFHYSSGCPLTTDSGFMVGSYKMQSDTGELFDIAVPAFALDLPTNRRTVN